MNIRFLGTGYGPQKIKKRNTKDFRRSASILIDDCILIDPTPQTFSFADDYGLTGLYRNVHTVLITTAEEDRFSIETLLALVQSGKRVCVYGDPSIRSLIPNHPLLPFFEVHPNEIFDVETAKVIAIPTVYRSENGQGSIGYAICTDRSLLYLPDGGFLHPDAWTLLSKLHFDHAVLGCPSADAPYGAKTVTAANFELNKALRAIFLDAKTLAPASRCFLTSIPSDRKRSIHEALLELTKDEGFTVAYDGLYLNI